MSLPTIHNLTPLSLKGLCEGAEFASFSLFPSPEPDEDKHSASCHAEPPCIVRQTYRGNRNENESLGHSRQFSGSCPHPVSCSGIRADTQSRPQRAGQIGRASCRERV